MQKFVFIVLAFAVGVGVLAPSKKPGAPASASSNAKEPGLFEAAPYQETRLQRKANGHFYVTAQVNGAPVNFIVDTGATSVALTETAARAAGIQFSENEFEPVARTANGIARGKEVTLRKVAIEGKEVTGVEAMIIEGADQSLLGQSYLARISGVQMNGDVMVLR